VQKEAQTVMTIVHSQQKTLLTAQEQYPKTQKPTTEQQEEHLHKHGTEPTGPQKQKTTPTTKHHKNAHGNANKNTSTMKVHADQTPNKQHAPET